MTHCRERKRFLSGKEIVYDCELLTFQGQFGVLRYSIEHRQRVGSLILQPGTVSYGFYWVDRPYILYKWFDEKGNGCGNYFSLADSVVLSPQEFCWRDLIVDVLVLPTGQIEILDEDEIPDSLDEQLRVRIERGKQVVLKDYKVVVEETTEMLKHIPLDSIPCNG